MSKEIAELKRKILQTKDGIANVQMQSSHLVRTPAESKPRQEHRATWKRVGAWNGKMEAGIKKMKRQLGVLIREKRKAQIKEKQAA